MNKDDRDFFSDIFEENKLGKRYKAFVLGKWIFGREEEQIFSPIDTNTIGTIPKLTYDDIEPYIKELYESGKWKIRNTPGYKRIEYLEKMAKLIEEHREDFIESLMIGAGKTRDQAAGEVNASINRLKSAMLDLRKVYGEYIPGDWDQTTLESESLVRKEPYGIVLAISPFNYPLFDTVAKFTYSVVAGNAVIIKPPTQVPVPSLMFARIAEVSGFPKESLMVLTVPGSEMEKVVSDPRIGVISLTGSSETGKKVLKAGGIKRYIMELGGGDPAIVLDDADIDEASRLISTGIYSYAGQRCDAIKMIIAHHSVKDELKKKIVENLAKVKVGDPRDPNTTMGPLISKKAVEEMMKGIQDAVEKGGKILYGGRRLNGNYVEPTLIEITDKSKLNSLLLYKEEVFAPVAIIFNYANEDEAVMLANNRKYGLDASIFAKDINRIRKIIRYLEYGAIYINDIPRHGIGYYPYGGRKESGIGRESIAYSIEEVMAIKAIVYNYRGRRIFEYLI
ncbi:NADP-dependent glyceraldehyde-3-phosphate dehydrogenase [Fervidicoccus fontis]|uniref:Nonphosphorylating glyceraldehyde-3-phosphate dehydrogenase n=1 Tax=Fervidicoccus fontis (strain DSM 19380 / JCM 18336 / VKM B-2539 / Kam940) TaxID=1163730 RepID=H9ZZH3_FERFK|nr:NADP-dependent glyceraldehyde-3-phosphate dehydrogenase [Fervidicoccus fontis]AFH42130.1 nonphosphorylating glyceraldehyde-3-phosphate dehydrogenase [Fervidicoccus fontis Kam940]